MSKKISIEELKKIMDTLLEATHDLAESHPEAEKNNHFLRVIEGIYRKGSFTFLGIRYLADQPILADSAVVLSRKMTEDVVSIEYMILKGKQEMAKRFQDFVYIQAYQEIQIRKKLGYDVPTPKEMKSLLTRVEGLKIQFWHEKSGQFMRSWSGMEMERMLAEIAKAKVFSKHEIHTILLSYMLGSWKNHPNPADTLSYMTNQFRDKNNELSLLQATALSIMDFIRLTTRYIDEIRYESKENIYEDTARIVRDIFMRLDSDEFGLETEKK